MICNELSPPLYVIDILHEIFNYLPMNSIIKSSMVCKRWKEACDLYNNFYFSFKYDGYSNRNDWIKFFEVNEKKEAMYQQAKKEGRDDDISIPITRRLNELDLCVPLTYSNMVGLKIPMPNLFHLSLILGMEHAQGVIDVWTDYLQPLGKTLISLNIDYFARPNQPDLVPLNKNNFQITWFKKLVDLDIRNNRLESGVFEDIDQLINLKKLWIDSNRISEEELRKIGQLPNLTSLSINDCLETISKQTIPISESKSIVYLSAGHNTFSNSTLKSIFQCVKLKYLFLPNTQLNVGIVNDIVNLKDLVELNLNRSELGDETMKKIGNLNQLKRLELDNCGITLDGVEHLTNLQNLTHLNVGNNQLMIGKCSNLRKLTKLTKLNLSNSSIVIKGELIGQLCQLINLESLHIEGNTFGHEEFLQICHVPTLKEIEINHFPIKYIDKARQLNRNLQVIEHEPTQTHPPLNLNVSYRKLTIKIN